MVKTKRVWSWAVVMGISLTACGTVDDGSGDNGAVPGDDDDEGPATTTGPVDPSAEDDSEPDDPETGEQDTDEGDTGCQFLCEIDQGSGVPECDLFIQDCPEGEKCMPWANDGGNAWNDTRCSPLDDNPGQVGDECTVEGSGVSGVDDCEVGAMCWNVDPETNVGTCTAMCTGDESNPQCEDPQTTCVISNVILCLPQCDPLLQDCPDGEACYGLDNSFTCAPDASGEMGFFGDPCEYINVCDPGLFCASAEVVPNCQGSIGCCSEFCDLDDPACTGVGQECVAWSENPEPGFESVGGCAIPS